MSSAEKPGTGSGVDGTSIDLGDDLLAENTRVVPGLSPPSSEKNPAVDTVDELASARILLNEGLPEEAKRTLRKILLAFPGHADARKMLAEIHDLELKQIFGGDGSERRRQPRAEKEIPISPDVVLESLDRDLSLGLFGADADFTPTLPAFDSHLAGLGPRDQLDTGIAFLEMGIYPLAIQQFEKAAKNEDFRIEATCLLGAALIAANRAFDAVLALEPLIEDSDIERAVKTELVYLMGRAFERLGKFESAKTWYRQAKEMDSRYRDVDERLRRMGG